MSTMTWNPQTHDDYDMLKGFDVYTADAEKVGTIKEVLHPQEEMPTARGRHYFKVEPGMLKSLFSDHEFFLPESLIRSVDRSDAPKIAPDKDKVILEVPRESLKAQDWSRPRELDTYRRS